MPAPAALQQVSSSGPALQVGSHTVTISENALGQLQGSDSEGQTGFTGTIFIVSNRNQQAGTAAASFAGSVAIGNGAPIASSSDVMVFVGRQTTSASNADTLSFAALRTAPALCALQALNAAAANLRGVYLTWSGSGVTIWHPMVAGAVFGVSCTAGP